MRHRNRQADLCNGRPPALLIESTPLKAGWLAPNISPQGTTSLSPMEFMTSDHRVAGSSPAGCKASTRADRLAVKHLKNQSRKSAVIRLLSGFPVLLASLTAHVRTNPRNLLACGYALSLQSADAMH